MAGGVVGIAIVIGAGYMAYRGVRKRFLEELDLSEVSLAARTLATRIGQAGHVAVGGAYAVLGALILVIAAGLACYGVYNLGDARYRRAWGTRATS